MSEITCAQWNGTLWLHRTDPSHCALDHCSCGQDTKEQYWGQKFCQMERDISVRDNWTGQSGLNILVGPNQNGLFHLMYQAKFLKFFVEWKAPQNSLEDFFYQPLHYYYPV